MVSVQLIMALMGALVAGIIGVVIMGTVTGQIDCPTEDQNLIGFQDCNNAKRTAWVVIGILPIALFFALFAVFGGTGASVRTISIANIEERAKKMEKMGVKHILKKTHAVAIDVSKRGNTLYAMEKMIPNYVLKYLVYEDPSTANKTYGCFVPSDFNTADQAMAWKFQITEEEYQNDLIYEA